MKQKKDTNETEIRGLNFDKLKEFEHMTIAELEKMHEGYNNLLKQNYMLKIKYPNAKIEEGETIEDILKELEKQ